MLDENARNLYGLPVTAIKSVWSDNPLDQETTGPGATLPNNGYRYMRTAQPQLETVGYYFARKSPDHPWDFGPVPIPGSPSFSVTDTTPLLVAALGDDRYQLGGWAKQKIVNGYEGKFGYLGQYFEKAYKVDSSGEVTPNETGILSPYGEFMPLEPGPTALVTMPDLDTDERGTAVVHVVSLALDRNHDGAMDLAYTGEDQTTSYRPFRFWVNNDWDVQQGGDKESLTFQNCNNVVIDAQRDLEDFARLWVCGIPEIRAADGYRVELSIEGYGSSPSINLYRARDAEGGSGYLTDTNAAADQFTKLYLEDQLIFDYGRKLATLTPGTSYTIPLDPINGGLSFDRFLFEGTGNGTGRLTLTVYKGETKVAETSADIELHDVKEMFEQAMVTNVQHQWPEMVEENRLSGFQIHHASDATFDESKEVVVFVHGWRLTTWDYLNFSETMFKRLYWQGYQGRFAALRWPTRSVDTEMFHGLEFLTFNRSEHIALKSGTGTAAYLSNLRERFPDHTISVCSHSQGATVMTEALKELSAGGQRPIDNYVIMQGAFPAQAFDSSVTNMPLFMQVEANVPTPNLYQNYGTGITNALRPGCIIVNFLNPVDFALNSGAGAALGGGAWELNNVYYDGEGPITMKPTTYLGYCTNGASGLLRTNEYNQTLTSIVYGGYYDGPTRGVANVHELLPFVVRARTKAVSAQAGVEGEITLHGEVNLRDEFGFSREWIDHSGEFNQNIQYSPIWPFYDELRKSLFPSQ